MFTGIVEATGDVVAAEDGPEGRRLQITAPFVEALEEGQSVSVDGACLTVETTKLEAIGEPRFEVFLSAETIERTTLGERWVGDRVNLERAMPADGRFDGHLVQGHVDATTEITDVREVGEDWTFEFALGEEWGRYVVEKGSIALDGVSLTVADRDEDSFSVAIIPTTYRETTLSERSDGDSVNVEVDVVAKYVEELC